MYLGLELPAPLESRLDGVETVRHAKEGMGIVDGIQALVLTAAEEVEPSDSGVGEVASAIEIDTTEKTTAAASATALEGVIRPLKGGKDESAIVTQTDELLDTLPRTSTYTPKMLYSHFARYDFSTILAAESKHRTAMLRQIADVFDAKTGKTLFYYYAVPHLCKRNYPPSEGETVTGQAVEGWRFLPGKEKEGWRIASVMVKKMLGDGKVEGLEVLRLESLDAEVVRLHELVENVLEQLTG